MGWFCAFTAPFLPQQRGRGIEHKRPFRLSWTAAALEERAWLPSQLELAHPPATELLLGVLPWSPPTLSPPDAVDPAFTQHLFISSSHMPGTDPGAGNSTVNKTEEKQTCPHGESGGQILNKIKEKNTPFAMQIRTQFLHSESESQIEGRLWQRGGAINGCRDAQQGRGRGKRAGVGLRWETGP